ncbi:uncharacterized protein LOC115213164 [Argonauta hians]
MLLILTTTWINTKEKRNIHRNTGKLWSLSPEFMQPIAYMENSEIFQTEYGEDMETLRNIGWLVKPIPKFSCGNVPVLKSMMLDAIKMFRNSTFYGFANSDIVFDEGLVKTLQSINKTKIRESPLLIIGQRTNVNFTDGRTINRLQNVSEIAKTGSLMEGIAIDYFITNNRFPWHLIPDLVIGRVYYDNWIVYFTVTLNATVIDATHTVLAVHQTTEDGNEAGRKHKNAYCNKKVIPNVGESFKTRWGYTTCAPFYTKWNPETTQIDILKRNTMKHCVVGG